MVREGKAMSLAPLWYKNVRATETRLERLNDIYLDGDISKDEYHAKKQNIEFEKKLSNKK